MDPGSISVFLQALRGAMEAAKSLGDGSIQKRLAEAMIEASKLQEEIVQLRADRSALQQQLAIREELEWDADVNAYIVKGSQDGNLFCPKCYVDGKAVPMSHESQRRWVCCYCKTGAGPMTESRRRPEPVRSPDSWMSRGYR